VLQVEAVFDHAPLITTRFPETPRPGRCANIWCQVDRTCRQPVKLLTREQALAVSSARELMARLPELRHAA